MTKFGASFSVPYAQYLGVDPKKCLNAAVNDLGVGRLRLMSYWNRLEPIKGKYDFRELDWQIELAEKKGVEVSLSLGLRQPRWPESHWPDWATGLPEKEWHNALEKFITAVVQRYRDKKCIVSYQLENEALLKGFGENGDFDRNRLKRQFKLIKSLDFNRPVIMTTSDSWGIPMLGPKPDIYAFSIYRHFFDRGRYRKSSRWPIFYRVRALLIKLIKNRSVFIHELQAEPWGPEAIIDISLDEQFKSMDLAKINQAVRFARKTGLYPIDIWGLEWWYWLKTKQQMPAIWDYLHTVYSKN